MEPQEVIEHLDDTAVVIDTPFAAEATAPALTRIRLWDLPTRLFHWSLVAAVTTAIVTGKVGGTWMELHGKAGLFIVGLVAFRLAWGFLGSRYARFLTFLPTPGGILSYLKGQWQGAGHNPLGAFSVFGLLALLGAQAVTGLLGNDSNAFYGPLFALVDESFSNKLTGWHHQLSNVLLVLIGLHVAAIAFYLTFKRDNLVKPMVTGWKDVPRGNQSAGRARPIAFIVSLLIAALAVYAASGAFLPKEAPPAEVVPSAVQQAPAW
ncbi:MAG TPA: cytochrome b/b6 domain-containing protein [Candidatus Aquabacterium excrementipullorum]|nr:cytochrome b/b6 domain-containing protein [Candidatus Aquabacterium excrementipullorum]